jgi:hypothetical protein
MKREGWRTLLGKHSLATSRRRLVIRRKRGRRRVSCSLQGAAGHINIADNPTAIPLVSDDGADRNGDGVFYPAVLTSGLD